MSAMPEICISGEVAGLHSLSQEEADREVTELRLYAQASILEIKARRLRVTKDKVLKRVCALYNARGAIVHLRRAFSLASTACINWDCVEPCTTPDLDMSTLNRIVGVLVSGSSIGMCSDDLVSSAALLTGACISFEEMVDFMVSSGALHGVIKFCPRLYLEYEMCRVGVSRVAAKRIVHIVWSFAEDRRQLGSEGALRHEAQDSAVKESALWLAGTLQERAAMQTLDDALNPAQSEEKSGEGDDVNSVPNELALQLELQ